MKLLGKEHWLVRVNYAVAAVAFLFTFAALQRTELVQEYAPAVWSLEFLGFTLAFAVIAFVIGGIVMNLGFMFVSTIYCIMTHDKEVPWFPRMILSAKTLIDRPRWMAEQGL